jgi:D-alanyl-D-alanine carboxypeptidase
MRRPATQLLNTPDIELWPAPLLRARSNADARALAASDWLLRRKADGQYLAVVKGRRLTPLVNRLPSENGLESALLALREADATRGGGESTTLPVSNRHLLELGIVADYAQRHHLAPVAEPTRLALAGRDRYRRPLWLQAAAANAWRQMRLAASSDGITLEAISGYRSTAYQRAIFERKLARGLRIDEITAVNAAPGYSEHHGGCALDISCPGEPAAETCFESTPAFAWLRRCAGEFGFVMSYPRGNPHGVIYEPWHWCWHPRPRH